MIDLETLSVRFDAAVVSIGVAIFNDEKIVDSAGWALAPKAVHGHIDPGTVMWWMQQDESARTFSFTGKYLSSTVAFELKSLLAKYDVKEVWSKDPHFDHVILESWWNRIKDHESYNVGDFPYHYRAPRSYRTLEAEAIRAGYEASMWQQWNYVAHNPVDDAVTQARAVIEMRRLMGQPHGFRSGV
jgi:hypothetical protein